MIYKKICGSFLTLGASFVATSSVSYSMVANISLSQYRQEMNTMTKPGYNYMDQSCFAGSCNKGIKRVDSGLSNSECGIRFIKALNEFRSVVGRSSERDGFKLADISSVISVQNKLIDVMSDVISSLLQAQQWQLDNGNEVRDMFTKLGNIFASRPTTSLPSGNLLSFTPEVSKSENEISNNLKKNILATEVQNKIDLERPQIRILKYFIQNNGEKATLADLELFLNQVLKGKKQIDDKNVKLEAVQNFSEILKKW